MIKFRAIGQSRTPFFSFFVRGFDAVKCGRIDFSLENCDEFRAIGLSRTPFFSFFVFGRGFDAVKDVGGWTFASLENCDASAAP